MREVVGFLLLLLCVFGLMLLGETLAWLFKAPKDPQRIRSEAQTSLFQQSGEERFSIKHIERFVLIVFVWNLSFFFMLAHPTSLDAYFSPDSLALWMLLIAFFGVWWSYRRGVLR